MLDGNSGRRNYGLWSICHLLVLPDDSEDTLFWGYFFPTPCNSFGHITSLQSSNLYCVILHEFYLSRTGCLTPSYWASHNYLHWAIPFPLTLSLLYSVGKKNDSLQLKLDTWWCLGMAVVRGLNLYSKLQRGGGVRMQELAYFSLRFLESPLERFVWYPR